VAVPPFRIVTDSRCRSGPSVGSGRALTISTWPGAGACFRANARLNDPNVTVNESFTAGTVTRMVPSLSTLCGSAMN
jgi:hypothetical protein